ncbi:acyltransferase [Trichocoleus desertorum]|uniref:acyltransferase n=1 Tax=Trichocoleus desertorum TaxID=1481672 RepID=UPI003296F2A7
MQKYKSICLDIISFFDIKMCNLLVEARKREIIRKLKACGRGIVFQMPIHINGLNNVELGNYVSIAAYVHIWGEGGVKIGNRVMIASHTAITSLTHDYNQADMHTTLIKGMVVIEDDVWIGTHSVIMPGISIGKGAVIGAGSVVTKDVEPNSIVFGIPAKHYKFRNEMLDNQSKEHD